MKGMKEYNVLLWNFNEDNIEHYNVIPYFVNRYNKCKKKERPKSLEEMMAFVERESICQFWSRCEYEMIVHGWPLEKNKYKIDAHEQIMMNVGIISQMLLDELVNKKK